MKKISNYVQYNSFSNCVVYDANFQPIETGKIDELFRKYNLRPVTGLEFLHTERDGVIVPCEVYHEPVQFVVKRCFEECYSIRFNPPLDRGETAVK